MNGKRAKKSKNKFHFFPPNLELKNAAAEHHIPPITSHLDAKVLKEKMNLEQNRINSEKQHQNEENIHPKLTQNIVCKSYGKFQNLLFNIQFLTSTVESHHCTV